MKKFFFAVLGITLGLTLALVVAGGGIYWWLEVREPSPPDISIEIDGFPDTRTLEDGREVALVRIVVTNNEDSRVSINDAHLYLTRVSDNARANISFEISDMSIYPGEKYVEVVSTSPVRIEGEWMNARSSDDFESEEEYFEHRSVWIEQLKEQFVFDFTFVSDNLNLRTLLDVQALIADIEKDLEDEKLGQ